MSTEDFSNIKYVAIEVIKKEATKANLIETGLYMGIVKKTNDVGIVYDFLVLMLNNKTIRLYNLTDYNIITIEVVHSTIIKSITVFSKQRDNQLEAKEHLAELSSILITEKKHYENDIEKELIDPNNYSGYKENALMSDGNSTIEKTQSSGSSTINNVENKITKKNSSFNSKVTKNTTDSINGIMKLSRRGKLPRIENLTTMKEKVRLVSLGEYKVKAIHMLPCDIEDKEEIKSEVTKTDDDDCYTNVYGVGMGGIT